MARVRTYRFPRIVIGDQLGERPSQVSAFHERTVTLGLRADVRMPEIRAEHDVPGADTYLEVLVL
jgi:hypothetical protein